MARKEDKKIPWNEIKAKYLLGATPKELAEKYGLTSKQIRDKAHREKWKYKKTAINDKVDNIIEESIIEQKVDRNAKHLEVWDLLLSKVVEQVVKAQNKIVYDSFGNPKTVDFTPKDIKEIALAIKEVQRGQRLAEGILTEFESQRIELERKKIKIDEKYVDKQESFDMLIQKFEAE